MPSMKIIGPPLLEVNLHLIYPEKSGAWGKWDPIREHIETEKIVSLFSYVDEEALEMAGYHYSAPLMKCLDLSPEICLLKLRSKIGCCDKKICILYSDQCQLKIGMPLCFDPEVEDKQIKSLVRNVLRGWADNYYWVVIEGI